MANHPSAEKRHRQAVKRAVRNQQIRTRVRSAVRKVRTAIASANSEAASADLGDAARTLDAAVSKGVLHRNNASRRISRLAKQVSNLGRAVS